MEPSTIHASIQMGRQREMDRHSLDDILFLIMGDATPANAVILILTMVIFGAAPVLLILLFANYSGGMRWLLTLGIVTALGVLAIYLMKRGIRKRRMPDETNNLQTEFRGQLTEITAAVDRSAAGYVYSQQMIRERLCDDIINRLALARDLSEDEIIARLEKNDMELVGDDILAQFLARNRRGGGQDPVIPGKGKSLERGRKFMMEIEVILDRIEEIV